MKLINLNIEGNRHWDAIVSFLEVENPDVFCVQELFEKDIPVLKKIFPYFSYVATTKQMYDRDDDSSYTPKGIGIFSKNKLESEHVMYYYGSSSKLTNFISGSVEERRKTQRRPVIVCTIEHNKELFTVASTHFTWTHDGNPNQHQDEDIAKLMSMLKRYDNLVITGDFNVPRGDNNRIYKSLTERFKDNIPADVKTSLDVDLHYAAYNQSQRKHLGCLMVDYVFSTPEYVIDDVRVKYGVSDHAAIVATVQHAKV